ncbi:MAG: ABC transporter ATP-binding protein [Alphaproteobacteria bacterium]|nr:ABC transporter ATP-binding protein [Alphaproteobacteria bacterium]
MKEMFVGVSRYALRYRRILVFLGLGLLFESTYDVAVRYSLKFVIDKAVVEGDLQSLGLILGALAIGAIVFNAVVIGCDYIWAKTGGRILNDIRLDMFNHLQQLPIGYFRRSSSGDLTARFNADMNTIEKGMILAFPMAMMGVVEIILTLILMLFVHPLMCAIAAGGIIISLLIPRIVQARALDASFVLRREEGRMAGHLQENISSQSVIKAYGLENHMASDFTQRLDVLLTKMARANFLSYLVSRLPTLSFLLLQLVVLGVGGWLAINGRITVGDLVAYQALLIGLNSAIFNLTWMIPSFIDASAGWRRIREILDEPVNIKDKPDARAIGPFSKTIEVENVNFQYPNAQAPSLRHVNLQIKAGEYVVFVGRSGAGKSSIINLIMRFYEVSEGRITVDGVEVGDVTLASLRGQVGLVSQEVTLFDTSVRDNIRLGALDASDEEIEAAAKAAEIQELIMSLPEGYDTRAGTAGARFSGGERQRIALARALVRRPPILVLDEFSSALDPATEAEILKTIDRLKGTCTILSVTHRLSMAENADKIVVMRAGRIVELGRHEELLEKKGEYARLWKRAASEDKPAE